MSLTAFLSSCSKYENEPVVQSHQVLQNISGSWYFKEPLTSENSLNTGVFFDVSTTSANLDEVNTYLQEITIGYNGRFNWIMIRFYPHTWLQDKQCWGEKTEMDEITGIVEVTDNKLSFNYDQWFMFATGQSFEYELSPDKQTLLLHGKTDGYQPISYTMKFYRSKP